MQLPRKIPTDGFIIIYALVDPRSKEIRYIGKTHKHIETRLGQHLSKARKNPTTHRDRWINALINLGLVPEINLIEYCSPEVWQSREIYWISFYRKLNTLTNHSDGGGGSNLNKGLSNANAKLSSNEVREAVVLYLLGCSFDQIKELEPFKSLGLGYKTLRCWAEKVTRVDETEGLPTKTEFNRECRYELY